MTKRQAKKIATLYVARYAWETFPDLDIGSHTNPRECRWEPLLSEKDEKRLGDELVGLGIKLAERYNVWVGDIPADAKGIIEKVLRGEL